MIRQVVDSDTYIYSTLLSPRSTAYPIISSYIDQVKVIYAYIYQAILQHSRALPFRFIVKKYARWPA